MEKEKQMLKYVMSSATEERLKQEVFKAEKEYWQDANKRWKKEFGEAKKYNPTQRATEYLSDDNWKSIKEFYCEIGQAVLDRRLKLWCSGSSGMMWHCGYIKKEDTDVIRIVGPKARALSPYWSFGRECFHVCCYGTSRPLEIILNIGSSLGIPWHSIHQNQQVL